jgi:hypothetical protein
MRVLVEHQKSQCKKKKGYHCGVAIGQVATKRINVIRETPKNVGRQRMKSYITSTTHIKINNQFEVEY